jgi:hypothetical protein
VQEGSVVALSEGNNAVSISASEADGIYLEQEPTWNSSSANESCQHLGLQRVGRGLGDVILSLSAKNTKEGDVTVSSPKNRTALCVLGQLRALGFSYVTWQSALMPFLQSSNHEVEFFVVTSSSKSYRVWSKFLQSMQAVNIVVVNNITFLDDQTLPWAYQEDTGGSGSSSETLNLNFNLAKFPRKIKKEAEKIDSYLIQVKIYRLLDSYLILICQHWQMSKCRSLILEYEAKSNIKYNRVARIRTDLLMLPNVQRGARRKWRSPVPISCFKPKFQGPACWSHNKQGGKRVVEHCEKTIQQCESSTTDQNQWVHLERVSDFYVLGSRNIMIEQVLTGLDWLSQHPNYTQSWNMLAVMPKLLGGRHAGAFKDKKLCSLYPACAQVIVAGPKTSSSNLLSAHVRPSPGHVDLRCCAYSSCV